MSVLGYCLTRQRLESGRAQPTALSRTGNGQYNVCSASLANIAVRAAAYIQVPGNFNKGRIYLATDRSSNLSNRYGGSGAPVFEYLIDHPQEVETIARWHHETWQHLSPGTTLNHRINRIRASAQRGRIPTTLVAFIDGKPVGCASLVTSDMAIRRHLSPWLASVFVVPHLRSVGIGSQLVFRTMQEARMLDVDRLYLYTPDRQSFYARLGWQQIETCRFRDIDMTIMGYELAWLVDATSV